jgi:hypothetical protein
MSVTGVCDVGAQALKFVAKALLSKAAIIRGLFIAVSFNVCVYLY